MEGMYWDICPGNNVCYLQHTFVSPDGKLLTIVGDNPKGMLVLKFVFNRLSSRLYKYYTSRVAALMAKHTLMTLCGHLDFSFASTWHLDNAYHLVQTLS
ncbi:hypothetical protein CFP56_029547 [Quercus suber]|uniref:Uncharacterized protein n=1 Tax=Quercus suber TaxID=58331 RepID=A0AAW0JT89_QUESU